MTWSLALSGHIDDRSKEKEIADLVRDRIETIVADLKEYGLSVANFNGNEYRENFLTRERSS